MKSLLYIAGLLLAITGNAQVPDTLTLDVCHDLAVKNYPLTKQYALLDSRKDIQIRSLNTQYLPQVQMNGQASYQSDVTKVEVIIPDIVLPPPIDVTITPTQPETPDLSKDQYKISLDVYQMIYDGGITARQKVIESLNMEIDKQKITVDLYSLKCNVSDVYFNILLLQENEKLLHVMKDKIGEKIKELESAVKFGVVLESEKDVLLAEQLKVEQQITEVRETRRASVEALGELMAVELADDITLNLPNPGIHTPEFQNLRPEITLFDLQKNRIDASKRVITAKWTPRFSGFGQVGYGRPALNFLNNDFDDFYIVGARMSWELWNWNKNKKEKQVLDIQTGILDTQKEAFDRNIRVAAKHDLADIRKYETLIRDDQKIIVLREKIVATASVQLNNGVITSTDYITRLSDATQARIAMQTHHIQLIRSRVNYLETIGNL
ncbi:MAG: TolC family protein [Bacteroidetes bacterium]|nr:TolC family protein [Bacteroidota bacterium]